MSSSTINGAENSKIPKVIHYVWVGEKPLSPLAKRCIKSWQEHLPDYELKRWDESNSPMEHHYVQAMYKAKKWAFVSDYIRFYVLAKEGGVYLDTDMEVYKTLTPLLEANPNGFVGRSERGDVESSIIATSKDSPWIHSALHFYDTDTSYSIEDTSPKVLEKAIENTDAPPTIFNHAYFHPCSEGEACDKELLKHAYARHYWDESWVPFRRARKLARRLGIMPLLKKLRRQ